MQLALRNTLSALALAGTTFVPLAASAQTPMVLRNLPIAPRPTAAIQAPPAKDDFVANEYLAGVWEVDSKGTNYGPWQPLGSSKLALQFDRPDVSGVIHGFVLGKPIVLLGRKVGPTGFRGIWMETAQPGVVNPTGRWGLASAQVGIAGKSIQVALSMGYRKPVPNSAGPGFPGRTLSGTYYMNANPATGLPSRGGVLKAWQKLVADAGPYPNMHGVYPDAKIDAAIQAWTRVEKLAENWGRSATVDPCAAECMGREPARIGFRIAELNHSEVRWSDIYGRIVVAPTVIEKGKPVERLADGQGKYQTDILSLRRSEAKRVFGKRIGHFVTPPINWFKECSDAALVSRYVLPTGLWTDPLREVAINPNGELIERDTVESTDDHWKLRPGVQPVKKQIGEFVTRYRESGSRDDLVESQSANNDFCYLEAMPAGADRDGYSIGSAYLTIHVF